MRYVRASPEEILLTLILIPFIALVVVVASAVRTALDRADAPPPSTVPAGDNGVVDAVVDGDTIGVTFDGRIERVRLIGINTPEVAHEAWGTRPANDAECYGPEAAAFTLSLLPPGTPVRVERDVVARDDYGRLLGYVYRDDESGNEVFVNFELVQQGYARPLSIKPNTTYQDVLVEAARDAEKSDLGLWSECK